MIVKIMTVNIIQIPMENMSPQMDMIMTFKTLMFLMIRQRMIEKRWDRI